MSIRSCPRNGHGVIRAAAIAAESRRSYGPVEVEFRRKDGTDFPAIVRCFLSVDPNGRRLVWSLIEDVTEIRAKEAALLAESHTLEATKSRFLAAIEALDDGFAVFDADDRLVLWNTPYVRVFAQIADLIVEGALYDDLLRAAIDRGVFGAEGERDEDNLQRPAGPPPDRGLGQRGRFCRWPADLGPGTATPIARNRRALRGRDRPPPCRPPAAAGGRWRRDRGLGLGLRPRLQHDQRLLGDDAGPRVLACVSMP